MDQTAPVLNGMLARHDPALEGSSAPPVASVIVKQAMTRRRPGAHIVVFANEKGGVGKSTLAFHTAVALAYSGARVLAIDLDRRQCSLSHTLNVRAGTDRALNVGLPSARHLVLERQSGPLLDQEIARIGSGTDFIVIDLPGADSTTARHAIAIANTLVTPVGSSTFDLNALGQTHPVTRQLTRMGNFGCLVSEIRAELLAHSQPVFDWLVLKNRSRTTDRRLEHQASEALSLMATEMNFRVGNGLAERIGFRDLLSYGLTYLDLNLIPGVGRRRTDIEQSIISLLAELELPGFANSGVNVGALPKQRGVMSSGNASAYASALQQHMNRQTD
ncbi:division plane positioning ATPase MipZ [Novosphingobium sp. AAP83]|uniref:division plane positioning ATPase MipZ n=1 Tax=Novosphingobium sp. AAP83 TaxID=1523425 RepID=UPI0009EB0FE8|nr:division plane positioning ATPase MipZ [Novosphingobium sp. AAP83]